jgi:hypothetical protein
MFLVHVRSLCPCSNDTPVDAIRRLRAEGHSVAGIARRTGATVAQVRRIVGKRDPADLERRRKEQEATAARIDARSAPWAEKVRLWKAATGRSRATFLRVIKRIRGRQAPGESRK